MLLSWHVWCHKNYWEVTVYRYQIIWKRKQGNQREFPLYLYTAPDKIRKKKEASRQILCMLTLYTFFICLCHRSLVPFESAEHYLHFRHHMQDQNGIIRRKNTVQACFPPIPAHCNTTFVGQRYPLGNVLGNWMFYQPKKVQIWKFSWLQPEGEKKR